MEVKDIIKEDRNKIVPSYEHRDYYREDGSRLYNSSREANWYKIGILDCFEYFEQNRLKACDNQTPQEAWREAEFVVPFVKEHHRTPTFSDAIEETRKQMIEKACKWLKKNVNKYLYNTGGYEEYIPKCGDKLFYDLKKSNGGMNIQNNNPLKIEPDKFYFCIKDYFAGGVVVPKKAMSFWLKMA